MMQSRYLTINSTHYRNYPEFKEDLAAALARLAEYGKRTIVHGDYCFSNILFDPMHYIFKLVDRAGGSGRRRFTATRGMTSPSCATASSGITILSLRGCTGWSRTGGTITNFRFRRRLWRRNWSRF